MRDREVRMHIRGGFAIGRVRRKGFSLCLERRGEEFDGMQDGPAEAVVELLGA